MESNHLGLTNNGLIMMITLGKCWRLPFTKVPCPRHFGAYSWPTAFSFTASFILVVLWRRLSVYSPFIGYFKPENTCKCSPLPFCAIISLMRQYYQLMTYKSCTHLVHGFVSGLRHRDLLSLGSPNNCFITLGKCMR